MNYGEKEMDHGHARLRSLYTDFQYTAHIKLRDTYIQNTRNIADAKMDRIKVIHFC